MSSPIQGIEKHQDHSAYAPKRTRLEAPGGFDGERRPPNEQSFPEQARIHRSVDMTSTKEVRLGQRGRRSAAEGEIPEASELQPLSEGDRLWIPRSLDPEFLRKPPPTPRPFRRLVVLGGLTVAALFGGAIVLFITSKFPSGWNEMLVLSTNKAASVAPKFASNISRIPEQATPPAAHSLIASMDSTAVGKSPARVAWAHAESERAPAVRGVTDNEIKFGISAPFTGAAKELGNQMKLGIETAFHRINDAGGVNGRHLRLVAADDGYEPTRTTDTMTQLHEKERVFGFIGNVGTPTAAVALPFALEQKTLFFGAFTGASLLRRDPPDRYVFNYRASYVEETDAVVRYLVKVRGLRPDQIAVFAQQDAYGDAGFAGVAKAMRALRGGDDGTILRLDYKRNTVDVGDAVARLRAHKIPIKAVVMIAAYRAAAKFIEKTRDVYPTMIYTNVSFVGSTALADELMLLGPRYANGVIVTQVVPAVDSYASTVLKYKTALAKYFPAVLPDYVSLEGYVAGNVLLEGLKRAGPQLDTERLVEALETVRDFDMGLGALISFGPTEHQGLHKVWGTQLNEYGRYQAIDLQ